MDKDVIALQPSLHPHTKKIEDYKYLFFTIPTTPTDKSFKALNSLTAQFYCKNNRSWRAGQDGEMGDEMGVQDVSSWTQDLSSGSASRPGIAGLYYSGRNEAGGELFR